MVVLVIGYTALRSILLSLAPKRKRAAHGDAGKEVEHEAIDEQSPIALEAIHIVSEQIGDAHIHHERNDIEKELDGLSHCYFAYCHNSCVL
jgi:hypothetical protein